MAFAVIDSVEEVHGYIKYVLLGNNYTIELPTCVLAGTVSNRKTRSFAVVLFPRIARLWVNISGCLFVQPGYCENGAATCSPNGETFDLDRELFISADLFNIL